jgi:hypothetical protein
MICIFPGLVFKILHLGNVGGKKYLQELRAPPRIEGR